MNVRGALTGVWRHSVLDIINVGPLLSIFSIRLLNKIQQPTSILLLILGNLIDWQLHKLCQVQLRIIPANRLVVLRRQIIV